MSLRIIGSLRAALAAGTLLMPCMTGAAEILIGVGEFAGPGGGGSADMAWGMTRLVEADMTRAVDGARKRGCEAWVVEVRRRDEVLKEHELSRKGAVDPSTQIDSSQLRTANRMVGGTVSEGGGQMS